MFGAGGFIFDRWLMESAVKLAVIILFVAAGVNAAVLAPPAAMYAPGAALLARRLAGRKRPT